jgi:UPF0716 protein FxsA
MRILLILLVLPIVEIALFIEAGRLIGLWPTLGLVLLAAIAGAALIRHEGLRAFRHLQIGMAAGGGQADPMLHSALVAVAGGLLLVPGILTDALGLVLLIPRVRAALIRRGVARLLAGAEAAARRRPAAGSVEIIEADYEIVEDEAARRPGRSGWTRQP